MKHVINILLFVLLVSCFSSAQDDSDFPSLNTNDIPGGSILQASYFDGNALWGHIDGGADLYLEYGFDNLLFQEIKWNGVDFRVEYYRMKDAAAAYGIYSVSRFKCAKSDTLSKYVCINPYQVQCALGRFYISIANDKGNTDAQNATVELFKIILSKSNEKVFELPSVFHDKKYAKYYAPVKFMRGQLGIQNGFPNWEEMFDGLKGFDLYVMPITFEKDFLNVAIIKFSDQPTLQSFLAKNNIIYKKNVSLYKLVVENITKTFRLIDSTTIVLIETNNYKMISNELN